MRFIQATSKDSGLRIPNVFHAGDGNIHPLILFDERKPDEVKRALAAGDAILTKCVELGGSVSGEHGIGIAKKRWFGEALDPGALDLHRRL